MALINELTNIGNAIREKTGGTELIPFKEMASAIQGISSGENKLKGLFEGTTTELVDDTITHIAHYLLLQCFPLTKIDLPALTTSAGNITIPTSIVTLNLPNLTSGVSCYNCSSLTTANFPKISAIPNNGFRNSGLTGDLIFENIQSIGNHAFRDTKVTSLDFADTLTSLSQSNTFQSCTALEKVIFRTNSVLPISNVTFSGSSIAGGTGYVYVPDDLVESYKSTQYWSNYANQIKGLSELGE